MSNFIKSHANFSTGKAFPSVETISQKSGISERQVKNDLKTLEEHGYIVKEKQGRNNVYTLREKILISDHTGKPAGQASWDYLPDAVRTAVADVKNVLMSGDFADAKVVKIENLQIVIVNAEPGANVNVSSGGEASPKTGSTLQ